MRRVTIGIFSAVVLLVLLVVLFREAARDENSIDLDLTQNMKTLR